MICEACREHRHGDCRGGSWCDCQHQPPPDDEPDEERAAEPPVNWRRQG
ncbi:hypothetical protein [Actinomadura atramentaria]|nr:hypothetical protein [Actinomadura atramentaria]